MVNFIHNAKSFKFKLLCCQIEKSVDNKKIQIFQQISGSNISLGYFSDFVEMRNHIFDRLIRKLEFAENVLQVARDCHTLHLMFVNNAEEQLRTSHLFQK